MDTRFERFTTVIFATPEIRAEVEALRAAAPPSGVPVMEAHVTTKGTFVELRDVEEVLRRLRTCAAAVEPFSLRASGLAVWASGSTIVVPVEPAPQLVALHDCLVGALGDQGPLLYPLDAPGQFRPHLTLVQRCGADALPRAEAFLRQRTYDWTFPADTVWLMGAGPDWVWHPVGSAPIGRQGAEPGEGT